MEPSQRKKPSHDWSRWELILKWGGLSKEGACAWSALWNMAVEQGSYSLTVHPAVIGETMGAGDRQRTGKRCLEALEAQGLIFVHDRGLLLRGRERGVWVIVLEDPWQIQQRRTVRASPEFQKELFSDDAQNAPEEAHSVKLHSEQAVVAQPPPSARSEVEVVRGAQIERSEVFPQGNTLPTAVVAPRPPVQVIERPADKPMPMAPILAAAMNRLAKRIKADWSEQPAEAQKIAGRIEVVVDDPNLARPLCLRVAWAIIDGLYPQGKLDAILNRIKRDYGHRSAKDRGAYFIGCMKKSFDECRLVFLEKDRRQEREPEGDWA